ncbi:anhydro-N-acetylmuramic acid kinase [Pelagibacterales bacterium SAG-MED13]|nr:anhydro-N-acetylmuramic acid kinase [Pelagibacterales bacterium SAG-MED13]
MGKIYTALGLMSGTSLDGVDVSIIESDGNTEYSSISNKYFQYDSKIIQKLLELRNKISKTQDLKLYSKEINILERAITLFHANAVEEILKKSNSIIDLIGFHGQTIYHNPSKKITKQLGDGKLLSQLTKKKVVYNFRQNDMINGGQGAPLTPIFHNVLANKINKEYNLNFPINILNIGGISNITKTVNENNLWNLDKIYAHDIGPGNCLIDDWIRKNSKKKYDHNGLIARSGNIDKLILNQALENFSFNPSYKKSLDVKDYDIFFAKGLSLENGAATITEFTAKLISDGIIYTNRDEQSKNYKLLVCGGGRKNDYLLERVQNNFVQLHLESIDKYQVDGDFVESQAFAFLAIRSIKNMPISFPSTTRCNKESTGGTIVKNF